MASTGAYRQALQQIFAIPIDDELAQQGNTDNNGEDGFSSFDEFQDTEQNNNDKGNQKVAQEKSIDEITAEDIDSEFANF